MSRPAICLIVVAILLAPFMPQLLRTRAAEDQTVIRATGPGEAPALKPGADEGDKGVRKPRRTPAIIAQDLLLKGEEPEPEEIIEQTLTKPTEVNFAELPLEEAIRYLKEYHDIDIWIDRAALLEAGVQTDAPITLRMKAARFESVLNLMLGPLGLDWLIQDEVLRITSHEHAAALADARVFDVQALLDAGHSPEDLIAAITRCVEPTTWAGQGGTGSLAHTGGVLVCRQSQRTQMKVALLLDDLEALAEEALDQAPVGGQPVVTLKVYQTETFPADELGHALQEMVDPKSWKSQGGSGSFEPVKGALLVKQTAHGHREVEKVLRQLLPAHHTGEASRTPKPAPSGPRPHLGAGMF